MGAGKVGGRSVTTRMPREEGPKAARRVEKGTVLDWRAKSDTVTGWPVVGGLDAAAAAAEAICLILDWGRLRLLLSEEARGWVDLHVVDLSHGLAIEACLSFDSLFGRICKTEAIIDDGVGEKAR